MMFLKILCLLVISLQGIGKAADCNERLLELNADSFANRIISQVNSSEKFIIKHLDFLEQNNIQPSHAAIILEDISSKYSLYLEKAKKINKPYLNKFYEECEKIFKKGNPLYQQSILLLLDEVTKKIEAYSLLW